MLVDKEQQVKNSFIYLLPVISSFLLFIAIPIFTRILSKEDYGIVVMAQVYAIFINGLTKEEAIKAANKIYSRKCGRDKVTFVCRTNVSSIGPGTGEKTNVDELLEKNDIGI